MQKNENRVSLFGLAVLLFLQACDSAPSGIQLSEPADLVLVNGRIYTQDPDQVWAAAVAVRDGSFIGVGTSDEMMRLAGDSTQVRDLQDRFVMPGIIDGHAHPAWGGLLELYDCMFPATASPKEIGETIKKCVADSDPETTWIQGGLWAAEFFNQYQIASPRAWLDQYSGDKAIALKDDSGHNYWVNSKALELLKLDRESTAPAGAKYGRAPDGELNGVLLETFTMLNDALPARTVSQYKDGIGYAVKNANGYGVVGWKDASAGELEVAAYQAVDQSVGLSVYVAASLYAPPSEQMRVDVPDYLRMRDQYRSERVDTRFVKIFLDGIPTTSRTAAMAAPYVKEDSDAPDDFGPLHVPVESLKESVALLDAAGFTVKIHAAGDRSVHEALNAIEHARAKNGNSGLAHELAHAGFILPEDIPRFAQLNAVADLSPHLWFPSPIIESVRIATGPRGYEYWPNRDLLDAGAPLLVGSDWPSVAPDLNPWIGMEAMVTRSDPAGIYPGVGWEVQALTVQEAIKIFTIDGAAALRRADQTGSIKVGKSADLIVLNHDLTKISASKISETKVHTTYFQGVVVYRDDANSGPGSSQ